MKKYEEIVKDLTAQLIKSNMREIRLLQKVNPEYRKILFTEKYLGDNKGQFGYYFNEQIDPIVEALNFYNLNSLIDFGAGIGHLINILDAYGFKVKGIEIEDSLIEESRKIRSNVVKGDIFTIKKVSVKDFDVIYFWEPVANRRLASKFVTHLKNIMYPGQYIFYRRSGSIEYYLNKAVKKEFL